MTGVDAGVGMVHLIGVVRNVGMARLVLMAHLVGVVRARRAGVIVIVAGGYPHSQSLHILRANQQMAELQATTPALWIISRFRPQHPVRLGLRARTGHSGGIRNEAGNTIRGKERIMTTMDTTMMNAITPGTGRRSFVARSAQALAEARDRVHATMCVIDARARTLAAQPEEGAATAEYAVVLVAATGFAALLVAVLKSDAVKTMLSNIVKKALNIG